MEKENSKIWVDGRFINWKDANVHILTHAIHYGSSVFEGCRCYKTQKGPAIFRLKSHIDRLYDSAKIYRMEIPYTKKQFCTIIVDTVKINGFKECYIRPVVFRGYGAMGVNPLNNPLVCAIACWEWGAYFGEEATQKGVSVCVSSWRRAAPDTFPSLAKAGGNYLNSQLIKMEALRYGFDEGIALDTQGYVSEASGGNIFIVKSGVIFTPPTSSSILAGITRHTVFILARELGIRIEQHMIPREALYIADEVFFTGTAVEVTPVSSIDNINIKSSIKGSITEKVQAAYLDYVGGNVEDKHNWLTYVE
ncbi:branched chain amino acid aminotransferase [bacterium Unc6]|nr:branched chain amino acid aminotransferase [bacterium Unc6]